MNSDTVLANARIVLDKEILRGSVLVRDGAIADISPGPSALGTDLAGDHLLPGVVELHTDHLEHHLHPRPAVRWDGIAAVLAHDAQMAASGATTVFDAVRIGTTPTEETGLAGAAGLLVDALDRAGADGILRVEHAIHLRCEVSAANCMDGFAEFADHPRVRLVSLMDHTPGQRQFTRIEDFARYYTGKGLIAEADIEASATELQELSARHSAHNRQQVAAAASERGLVLASHDDATPEHVAEADALGARIAEFPTTVDAARVAVERGLSTVMGAPNIMLGGSQSGNVAATDLIDQGLLHILSSDYVPSSPLQAVFRLVDDGAISLVDGVRLVSGHPARAAGFDDRGRIALGMRADLVRVQLHAQPGPHDRPSRYRVPVVRGVYRRGTRVA
ncbi:alpha-D-ribose 1-methylphosphonate 5-triphosphate diphosphatase [Pseudonocardia sp. HH130630-07]|uniref:alpha-D-ribose 1-methylphosphonate 5-triphosphate diphosphatase n=1 Tax=Pseudonocardia sp. HH130630-07 TaxID=1690815 RepID=UPI000814F1C5|nr:alpha-D-ribose 1-methylphosphonate 5-triphosphate diphosphatase [Pseudonocardia sp. HH130630-07]ANY10548.1 alpha-D-ribose 1-methylphosphonate 5-triphosphate diphosphatase [Pseudonocardia sp. HH130630-07]